MKINVTQQITDLDGTPLTTGKQICPTCGQPLGKNEPMTMRNVAVKALSAIYSDERDLSGEDKVKRYGIALKLMDSEDAVDLKAEEIVVIKSLVGKMYGPIVVGRVWEILDRSDA